MTEDAPIPSWTAIAAMSLNRVIGREGRIPWHLPEDFRFFRQTTMGQVLVMGRRTFLSIGRALPGRHTLVLSRQPEEARRELAALGGGSAGQAGAGTWEVIDGVKAIPTKPREEGGRIFICGGADVYRQLLPRCASLLLTRVKREVEGDAIFPPFEDLFARAAILQENAEFTLERWERAPRKA